ncbi:hypothetical protein AGOR_G00243370 [Albula goreensis]|uniref:Uncharacterized protein n=1 Tax=Albula goreensis TaxID=1534307 RepID=A0A8T3CE38_9TELE|nr:hypothetical protein AGOR_G00243370 [Albula goreensis]
MNYIFGNSTLYPRGSRGTASSGQGPAGPAGPKLKHWPKRGSSEDPPSRWQQFLAFFSRRNAFTDCITAGATQVTLLPAHTCRVIQVTLHSPA